MKAKRGEAERTLAQGGRGHRIYLLHGPDTAATAGLVQTLARALGPDAERSDIAPATLRADSARLADEAVSASLFAPARYILCEGAGDEVIPAVEAVLDLAEAVNPILLTAGALRKTSKLLILAEGSPLALAQASYAPEGREAENMVRQLARDQGLSLTPDLARALFDANGGDRTLVSGELAKFALYLDASPAEPRQLDEDIVSALGQGQESDLTALVDALADGAGGALVAQMAALAATGTEGITVSRAALRRICLLAALRGEIEEGKSVESVMASRGKSLFYKDKASVQRQVQRWRAARLRGAVQKLVTAEIETMRAGGPGAVAIDEVLVRLSG